MVKELIFDLHFTGTAIRPLTTAGRAFVRDYPSATPNAYIAAVDRGLHVRFENSVIRDYVTSIRRRG